MGIIPTFVDGIRRWFSSSSSNNTNNYYYYEPKAASQVIAFLDDLDLSSVQDIKVPLRMDPLKRLEREFFTEYGEASRYQVQEVVGKGSYGVVGSATDTKTGEKVAIKKINDVFEHVSDATRILREIKLLRLLRHPDIVEIRHIMLPPSRREFRDVYVVFELMESDLHQVIRANDDLTPEHYQFFLYQLLRGLKYIHSANVFHRDLKPKNILANADCKLKICDFGLARVSFDDAPTAIFWTDYVATRWYRAPELCGSFFSKYTPAIDIWSIGCIFAEMLTGKPLFPGKNVVHQLDLMTDLLGTPPPETIARIRNEKARRYLNSMRKKQPIPFTHKFPNVDPLALKLLERLIAFDPIDRPSAAESLADPYFNGLSNVDREPCTQPISKLEFEFERRKLGKDDVRELIYREILEYHPQMLQEYLRGGEQTSFLYSSGVDRFKRQFAHLEEGLGKGGNNTTPLLRQHASLPRERVPAPKEEGSSQENELENQTSENAEGADNEVNKGNCSARSLLKSASISASKCIGGKGTRDTELLSTYLQIFFLDYCLRRNLERSDYKIVKFVMWWSQLSLYVGRGMHEDPMSLIKYTLFWTLLLMAKLSFSYYLEIKPLVGPTKAIMQLHIRRYEWHEFFPQANSNIGVVIALWAPIILVYFMDTQIWYAIFSTIFGGIYGAFRRLGEIRTLGMLRSRFQSLPGAFNDLLIAADNKDKTKKGMEAPLTRRLNKEQTSKAETARFAHMWNKIITSFREEDLISNREMDLLLMPCWGDFDLNLIQWPPFLLASKLPIALDMAKDSKGKELDRDRERELQKRLNADSYMLCAVKECYASCKNIFDFLILEELDKSEIAKMFEKVDHHIMEGDIIKELNMSYLPSLADHLVQLIEILIKNEPSDKAKLVIVLLNMMEVVKKDIFDDRDRMLDDHKYFEKLNFPVTKETDAWKEKIRRLHLLLTEKESAMDVPSNLEARRRMSFFSNSLFMDMPVAPKVRNMISFSVLTPYYNEDVLFSIDTLEKQNEDGVSILFYLQKIFPDEYNNFLERVDPSNEEELKRDSTLEEKLCLWASYRGQTLTKTVRGMMYYRQALELQAFLDMATDDELTKGYKASGSNTEEYLKNERSLLAQCQAVADMKFTYVISCQLYGIQKRLRDARARDILRLMTTYPSLRVAYIDEVEEPGRDEVSYYSVLVKAVPKSADASDQDQNFDQIIYRIKLPGPAILGEGKPENQNHAIIFTRGEGLQTIDMNQDNYMEEAFKMRNLLQEFLIKHGVRTPTILGLREHIFTGSVSSLAWFMSNQETSFVTIGQRLLANPLKVRFHYGHPDVFERLFHITRGGISKASKIVNLSEDIFAGFNSTLRGGNVTHHEYIQVGKGRDVGLNQISLFEAKIANGNGEQTMSRDIYRLGHRFDFFRMLSCYFTTVGFYFNTLLTVLIVYVFLYGRLYLVLSGLERELSTNKAVMKNNSLQVALASQSFVQIGFLMALPMIMEIGLERGFRSAFTDFVLMQLQLASVFFTFSLGTKTHYFGRTLLHGGAQYRATGRGFVVFHAKFAENYRLYSRSHFVKGIELLILLVVYEIFGQSYRSSLAYILITVSMWFMVGTWLFAPFLFNPSGFEWQKIVDDWTDWGKWISNQGGIGVSPEKSWESWWEKEQQHLLSSGIRGTVIEILLATRFFIYQFGLVYHLNITKSKSFLVYGISWLVIFAGLSVMKAMAYFRKSLSNDYQLAFRLIKGLVFVTFLSVLITIIAQPHMTAKDIVVCLLALMPTGWGMLLIAQALKPFLRQSGFWSSVRVLAQYYEMIMGLILFTPVAFLAWFPFVSEFQTRMLFNQAFSRGLQISRILGGGQKKDKSESTSLKAVGSNK